MSGKTGFTDADVRKLVTTVKKCNKQAAALSAELLTHVVVEVFKRARVESEKDASPSIEAVHLSRVLPQVMLDFF
jgi:hypothetical protein